jgi:hypothetical protein
MVIVTNIEPNQAFSFVGLSGRRYLLQYDQPVEMVEDDLDTPAFQNIRSHCVINTQKILDEPAGDVEFGDPEEVEIVHISDGDQKQCTEMTQSGTQCKFDAKYVDEDGLGYCTTHAKQRGLIEATMSEKE